MFHCSNDLFCFKIQWNILFSLNPNWKVVCFSLIIQIHFDSLRFLNTTSWPLRRWHLPRPCAVRHRRIQAEIHFDDVTKERHKHQAHRDVRQSVGDASMSIVFVEIQSGQQNRENGGHHLYAGTERTESSLAYINHDVQMCGFMLKTKLFRI